MKKNTRFAFNAYLQQLARLNGVAVEELSSKFTVEPSVQQTLEDQIQQSAAFLTLINVTPVTEQSGQLLGLGVVAATPAELPPLHPLALPAKGGEAMVSRAATVPPVQRIEAPMQIIIQTQPGQSAQDIAREVARQLDERERRLKAKARSNYSDQGGYDA